MCTTLKIIQQLVMASDLVGPALVPFYRQLLPAFNVYKIKNRKFFKTQQLRNQLFVYVSSELWR